MSSFRGFVRSSLRYWLAAGRKAGAGGDGAYWILGSDMAAVLGRSGMDLSLFRETVAGGWITRLRLMRSRC